MKLLDSIREQLDMYGLSTENRRVLQEAMQTIERLRDRIKFYDDVVAKQTIEIQRLRDELFTLKAAIKDATQ